MAEPEAAAPVSNLTRLLDQRAPRLAAAVAAAGLNRGRERFDHFLEKAFANPAVLERLDGDGKLAAGVLDLFEHSPYFADELLRQPELLDEIGAPLLAAASRWRTAARCGVSTGARCCASRARASCRPRPFSPRCGRLRRWPTA